MSSSSTHLPTPEGPGSVSGAPNLPAGFTDTFTSRYIDTDELRLHAVTGGEGPTRLLHSSRTYEEIIYCQEQRFCHALATVVSYARGVRRHP